jgi:hypothetical protein
MGTQKTLTNEKYIYNCKEFQVYKTKRGAKLIKINNNFVNINNAVSIHNKINEKNLNTMIAENISELTEFDLASELASELAIDNRDIGNHSDSNDSCGGSNDSIDGEEYIIVEAQH